MSRSKSKKVADEIGDLKRTIKDRDATIKSLQRELKALNKELEATPKKTKKKLETEPEIDIAHKCPMCPKKLAVTHLGARVLFTCTCGFRLLKKPSES